MTPTRTTAGLVAAGITGTRSRLEECAPLASTSGFDPVSLVQPMVAAFRVVCDLTNPDAAE